MNRLLAAATMLAPSVFALAGCGPSYSPNTYATNAAQQENKVEAGIVAGVRPVQISASGTVGGVAGAAAGGVAGSQIGTGTTSTFAAIGGSLLGGLAGVATEHIIGDTNGFEYIVRKANGDMISVAQKDAKPLWVGEKVLVIAGPQARIVPDYTVPFEAPPKPAATAAAKPAGTAADAHPAAPGTTDAQAAADTHPAATDTHAATAPHPAAAVTAVPLPAETGVPPQLPAAFGSPSAAPPPIITPPDIPAVAVPPALANPAGAAAKP